MADSATQQTLMVNGEVGLVQDISALVTSQSQDILQQALQQTSSGLTVTYDSVENAVAVIHGELPIDTATESKQMEMAHLTDSQLIDSTDAQTIPVYQEADPADITDQVDSSTNIITESDMVAVSSSDRICGISPSNHEELDTTDQTYVGETNQTLADATNHTLVNTTDHTLVDTTNQVLADATGEVLEDDPSQALADSVNYGDVTVSPRTDVDLSHLTLPPKSTSAPLGSSANPIQIIQQGNTYHSTQVLTQEQLQQIAHVLQQQQVSKALNNGGKAVLYNPATNTRIIYRVIYPSELNKASDSERDEGSSFQRGGSSSRGRGRPRKGWGKKNEEEENKMEGPELSREEKEKKKKHRPRTRSGRISKPPAYMMRDYKRIHHLDFDEEPYDDSDGGYSDYQMSDEDGEKRSYKSYHLPPGVTTAKARNYKCRYCEKAYIGRGGLARHFRLNPSHGNIIDIEEGSTQDENSNSSMASVVGSTTVTSGHQLGQGRYISFATSTSKDDDHQHSRISMTEAASNRRKARLRDILNHCQDEEIMEVVMPQLTQNITLWEFLLMKTEATNPSEPHISAMLEHFESLLKHIQKVAKNCLAPASPERKDDKECFEVCTEELSRALNLDMGIYQIKRFGEKASLGTKCPTSITENANNEITHSTEESMNPSKKRRLDVTVDEALSSTLSDHLLNESVDHIDLAGLRDGLVSEIERNQRNELLQQQVAEEFVHNSFNIPVSNYNEERRLLSASQSETVTSTLEGTVSKSQIQNMQHPTVQVRKVQIFSKMDEGGEDNNSILEKSSINVTTNSSNMLLNNGQNSSVITSDGNIPSVVNVNVRGTNASLSEYSEVTRLMTDDGILLNSSSVPSGSNVIINVPDSTVSGQNTMKTEDSPHCATEANSSNVSCANMGAGNESTISNEIAKNLENENQLISEEKQDAEINQMVCSESGEGTAVIRQLVLPDGQIIGTWSTCGQVEGISELGDQLSQGYMPNNVVIVQNPDGSTTLQVPSDQSIPLETLQALLAMDPTIIGTVQDTEIDKTQQMDSTSQ